MDSSNKKYMQDLVSKMNKKEIVIKYNIENDTKKSDKKPGNNGLGLNINIIE